MIAQTSPESEPLDVRALCVGSYKAAFACEVPVRDWSGASIAGWLLHNNTNPRLALEALNVAQRYLVAIAGER